MDAQTTQTKTETDAMLRLAEHSAAQLHAQIIESCRQAVAPDFDGWLAARSAFLAVITRI